MTQFSNAYAWHQASKLMLRESYVSVYHRFSCVITHVYPDAYSATLDQQKSPWKQHSNGICQTILLKYVLYCIHKFPSIISWYINLSRHRRWMVSVGEIHCQQPSFNSLAPGRCGCHFETIIFKLIIQNSRLYTCYEITLTWMPENLTNEKSKSVHAMVLCYRAKIFNIWGNVVQDLCHHIRSTGHKE